MKKHLQRPVGIVPRWVLALFVTAFCAQVTWQALQPRPDARAEALSAPPAPALLRPIALGEPIALAQLLNLYLQAFDSQPGISVPFHELDYRLVIAWLRTILELDPVGQYPLLMASQIYSQVPDQRKQRQICEFVREAFDLDPDRRWRWLAHCAIMAKHRLHDVRLALSYAEAIAHGARNASSWARQMRIFILEDLGEMEAAKVLLGGLLASGEVTEPKEIHFLMERLKELEAAGNASSAPRNRHPKPRD